MIVQINFEKPIYVSAGGERDELLVNFTSSELFVDE